MGILSLISGWAGPSGFGSASTAEQVSDSIDASDLTTGKISNSSNDQVALLWGWRRITDGLDLNRRICHFHLTNLLLDKMKETAATTGIEGRIVNLSSVAHRYTYEQGIIFDKINDKDSYCEKKAYGQSKLANILHANELSRRLKEFLRCSLISSGKLSHRVQQQVAM
ncbi:hypothetical protein L1987_75625 [Smallanthus sonchifolius]|uniref:Uncharacterized protein n=1 Tax=Smallanthus sonchifolius TaxID=185202 RepID=A0ACB9A693_9ASTR|nr:hypothetical protein L1987_75625 [Smallanthus sonchifolius]